MKAPTNQTAAILQSLIRDSYVTEQEFCFNGFRARISELRQLVTIDTQKVNYINQFGHSSYYNQHSLNKENKKLAKEVYEKINLRK
jgi:hypothetical protein